MTTPSSPTPDSARALLRDVAFDHIRTSIIDGTYAPGSFLSERDLARTLDMSKTPIRVAFERLAEQGLVSIAPQRGVVVREMTGTEISEHYELRMALESFVARRLAEQGIDGNRQREIEENLRRQEELVHGEVDIQGFMQADSDFHLLLVEALGNGEIQRTMSHQRDRVRRVVENIFQRDHRVPPMSVREHRAILTEILAGDAVAAAQAAEHHLENGRRFLLLGGTYGETR